MWTSLRGRCWSSSVLTGRARASCLKRLPCCNGPARAGCSSRGEPSSALDEPTREELLDDLSVALGETGVTTVFVTHDRGEAMRLGGRMVVLMNGEIRQVGPTAEVFASPVDAEVASFVGVETIAPGRVRSLDRGLAVVEVAGRRVGVASTGG